jgi:hypothetical protein
MVQSKFADQAVPNVHLRLIKYVLPRPEISREWIGLLYCRLAKVEQAYERLWFVQHGS